MTFCLQAYGAARGRGRRFKWSCSRRWAWNRSFCRVERWRRLRACTLPFPLLAGIWGGKGQGKTFQVELIFKALGLEPIILPGGEMESEGAGEPGRLILSVSFAFLSVPFLAGIWGGKGQGKTFQVELIFKALGLEPIILSAGEMESEWAGEPGRLIRSRYRDAHLVINNKGKMSALMINDLDAGIGRFAHTQTTVNNQMVVGTLMSLCDDPTRASVGQDWREGDLLNRVPIIVTGNDFSTLWAPLIRDGRMEKFYWQPTREDIVNIVYRMYIKDGLSLQDIERLVDTFPNQ
ncbi:unnamed protein product, partial [Closterium sp. NIES-64]